MADKPGRRWREGELTGKRKAMEVLMALQEYAVHDVTVTLSAGGFAVTGKADKVAIDKVLREKFGLKTPSERAGYRKAYYRWADELRAELARKASDNPFAEPGEEKQRQPIGRKPPGMVWRDGFWQDIENSHKK